MWKLRDESHHLRQYTVETAAPITVSTTNENIQGYDDLKDIVKRRLDAECNYNLLFIGHIAAWEQPQLFSEEVRAGFRSLRS
ncbi:MAG TPA: hypothetical protein VE971_02895 [Candidatus Eisenbacteria bacterium]|nr:hypothetical protein [Candidatus Eisenbacteria bacterium]